MSVGWWVQGLLIRRAPFPRTRLAAGQKEKKKTGEPCEIMIGAGPFSLKLSLKVAAHFLSTCCTFSLALSPTITGGWATCWEQIKSSARRRELQRGDERLKGIEVRSPPSNCSLSSLASCNLPLKVDAPAIGFSSGCLLISCLDALLFAYVCFPGTSMYLISPSKHVCCWSGFTTKCSHLDESLHFNWPIPCIIPLHVSSGKFGKCT